MKTLVWTAFAVVCFPILAQAAVGSTLTVSSPVEDEVLTNHTIYKIAWQSTTNLESVVIYLSDYEGDGFFVTTNAPNTGEYVWVVDNTGLKSEYYKLTVGNTYSNDVQVYGVSGWFTIIDGPKVASPIPTIELTQCWQDPDGRKKCAFNVTLPPYYVGTVEWSTNLVDWSRLTTVPASPDGKAAITTASYDENKFFRVRVQY